jgi:uncharacterized membrane protein
MSLENEVLQLRELVGELTRRIYRLEQRLGVESQPITTSQREPVPGATALPTPQTPRPEARPNVPPAPAPLSVAERMVEHHKSETGDLEQRIGSQWLNRIGIIAVLIGVSYFLKYAFDNGWIGPGGRIAIGLLAGIGVVFWSERFRRKSYVVFSYSLKAVGIGVMYLSLWAAFQLYHLIPAGIAFFAMLVVTAATAALALAQDAEILAALALVGGFATPALVSTGENHEVVLFSYVVLLDLFSLVLLKYRPWRRLLIGSFVGTLVMYVGWNSSFYTNDQLGTTVLFITMFMLIFASAPLITDTREGHSPGGAQTLVGLAFANAAVYFLEVMELLDRTELREYRAWVAVALAAFYLLLSRTLAEKVKRETDGGINRAIPLLHIGVAVGLLTVAIPLKLSGHWITFGWLVEAAVLFWVGRQTKMNFLKVLSLASLALGLARLLTIDSWRAETFVVNERFGMYLLAIAVIAFMVAMMRDELENPTVRTLAGGGVILINVLALMALCWEVDSYWSRAINNAQYTQSGQVIQNAWREVRGLRIARDFSYSAVWMFYGAALMVIGFWKQQQFLRWQAMVLVAATILKVFIYDVSALDKGYRILSFLVLGAILLAISFLYQRDILKLHGGRGTREGQS